MKHDIAWEDDGLVGVRCWNKTTKRRLFIGPRAGQDVDYPTDGGSIGADGGTCDSCGQRLTRTWKVALHEHHTDTGESGATVRDGAI